MRFMIWLRKAAESDTGLADLANDAKGIRTRKALYAEMERCRADIPAQLCLLRAERAYEAQTGEKLERLDTELTEDLEDLML